MLEELEGLSARAIAAELNRRGIATPNGGKWQSNERDQGPTPFGGHVVTAHLRCFGGV